ncbi:hypothetical protein NLX67_05135 [Domibacillus sp. A3M-37]|uniref:helix-turn-helix domain-containing protein n=1 Tax=Domibacillus TaxID=1433999 RepID=UPI0020B67185|nr:helix-turn-helix domain-containing protein [Domibacillus sp. A3M-37]MCP3761765.1 hypothetical protein [Domibacillus sp. A3M-37]
MKICITGAAILLEKLSKKFDRPSITLSKEAENRLMLHSWPGNIRELENVLERAVNVMEGTAIRIDHLPLYLQEEPLYKTNSLAARQTMAVLPLKQTIQAAEKRAIEAALEQSANKTEAVRLLGIGKTKLYEKCREYGL